MNIELVKESAREVYKELNYGYSETTYESAMEIDLSLRGAELVRRQVTCPIYYKGFVVGTSFIDILVDEILVIEVKTVSKISQKDEAQVRKYLIGRGLTKGLLINFGPELEIVEVTLDSEEVNNIAWDEPHSREYYALINAAETVVREAESVHYMGRMEVSVEAIHSLQAILRLLHNDGPKREPHSIECYINDDPSFSGHVCPTKENYEDTDIL